MTNTKKLIWRLKEQPSSESLLRLVKDNLLTKDEAREILFSSETEEDRDKKSLESEIKFLRELVEKLSSGNNSRVVEIIRKVERPYVRWNWYRPYENWCTNASTINLASDATITNGSCLQGVSSGSSTLTNASNFSGIRTF